jgi:hypothetical protein
MELQIGIATIVAWEGNMPKDIMIVGQVANVDGWRGVSLEQNGITYHCVYKYYRVNRLSAAWRSGKVYRGYKDGFMMKITMCDEFNVGKIINFSAAHEYDDGSSYSSGDEVQTPRKNVKPWMVPLPHVHVHTHMDTPRPVMPPPDMPTHDTLDQILDHVMPIVAEERRKIREDAERDAANIIADAKQLRHNGVLFLRRKFVELHQIGERIIAETVDEGEAQIQLAIQMVEEEERARWHKRGIEAYEQVYITARKRAKEEVEQANADERAKLEHERTEIKRERCELVRKHAKAASVQEELGKQIQTCAKMQASLREKELQLFEAHAEACKRGREEGLAQATDEARRIRQKATADVQAMIMRAQRSGSSSSVTP